jgi:hypothetical protein|uniref:Ribosomal protein L31 n=1 Tax=Diphylleia rotans TaxID=190327 RepID=A0A146I5U9_9EUKA|nr:ribosomal protein L31 [Diphylleia rotans]BAU71422.1 ribosomal protein L31 [Diphylleia rotans]
MKKNKHPQLNKLLVFLSNGTTCEMRTTISNQNNFILKLEYDSKNNKNNYYHPNEAPLNAQITNDPSKLTDRTISLLKFSTMINKISVR